MGQSNPLPANCCDPFKNGIICSSTRITQIHWPLKGLKNSIPTKIGKLTGLTDLSLGSNQLSGPIPSALRKLTNLSRLWLSNNQLSGPIPSALGNLPNLQSLDLSSNQLSGPIPSALGNLPNLQSLYLYSNQLSGPIPSALGKLTNLSKLYLTNNQLSGVIPPELGHLTNLSGLSLASNQLSGPIPFSLGNLPNLQSLWLYNNQLSGPIPPALGNLPNLRYLLLYDNQLTGYPSALKTLIASVKIFPNPMSDVPYDLVTPASAGTLSTVTWDVFLTTPVSLRKRQELSTSALTSTQELIKLCDLNTAGELPAGCISGIYNMYCTSPTNTNLLLQCHDAYNRAFGASKFKAIGDVCPSWKVGPRSPSCLTAVKNFKAQLEMGRNPQTGEPIYLTLTATHAEELRKNIFASPRYAPCVTSDKVKCNW